jgi:hypothetical protein
LYMALAMALVEPLHKPVLLELRYCIVRVSGS